MKLGKLIFTGLIAYAVVKFTEHIAKEAAKTVLNEKAKKEIRDNYGPAVPKDEKRNLVDEVVKPRTVECVKGIIADMLGLRMPDRHPKYAGSFYGMFVCKHCGHTLRSEDRWCPNCGEKVTEGRYHYG